MVYALEGVVADAKHRSAFDYVIERDKKKFKIQ